MLHKEAMQPGIMLATGPAIATLKCPMQTMKSPVKRWIIIELFRSVEI